MDDELPARHQGAHRPAKLVLIVLLIAAAGFLAYHLSERAGMREHAKGGEPSPRSVRRRGRRRGEPLCPYPGHGRAQPRGGHRHDPRDPGYSVAHPLPDGSRIVGVAVIKIGLDGLRETC